ncbi:MAG: S9 family peptidase [Verrucomicrobia bacterium]|nr:S9 family peptidase [Verrucomicrobiota bacterium]
MKVPWRRGLGVALALGLAAALAASEPAPKRFDAAAFRQLVRLSEPQISPDGRSVLLVVARQNHTLNRWENQLVKIEVASGRETVLTRDYPDLRHPRWSPSGDRIAFLSAPAAVQIFLLPAAGGKAQRISGARRGVLHFAWRPDGKSLAFATPEEPGPQTPDGRELALLIDQEDYLATTAAKPVHAWLQSVRGGEAQRLTSGEWSLADELPPGPPSGLGWTPDGRQLIVTQKRGSRRDEPGRRVALVGVEDRAVRVLTDDAAVLARPVCAPDGRTVALLRRPTPLGANAIAQLRLPDGALEMLGGAPDRCFYTLRWEDRGQTLLGGCNAGTLSVLWRLPLTGAPERLDLGELSLAGFGAFEFDAQADAGLAFVASGPQRPPELYWRSTKGAPPRRLTNYHARLAGLALGAVETIEWECDGRRLDGVLTSPPGALPGQQYPLVLDIHGGPQAASQATFRARSQWLAAQGWLVFEPNYRGSDSGGAALVQAIEGDPAEGPARDILSGLAELEKSGRVDRRRVALSGFSYGGFLAGWIASQPETRAWSALVLAAAPAELAEQTALSDTKIARRQLLPGEAAGRYSLSARARSWRAPTLLLANTADVRVPVTHSFRLFHALREAGAPVEFVVHPVAGHGPPDPARALDLQRRWVEWITARRADGSSAAAD